MKMNHFCAEKVEDTERGGGVLVSLLLLIVCFGDQLFLPLVSHVASCFVSFYTVPTLLVSVCVLNRIKSSRVNVILLPIVNFKGEI
ncbi:hypothetical protein Ahy_A06g027086 isoform A [Arachis hypogaea]|uniref:Uncharacterized protein n=1 Tax=Arachis hypogaea TaxID=3818 RepID=A0A445CMM6_ARAHY|nr:hypothetical protein Ahy_A06g027086 isoform A [Arachis hypogaea]